MAARNKTHNKKWLWAPVILTGVGLLVLGARNPQNQAQTRLDTADKSLRTRFYNCSLPQAREAVLSTIPTLKTYGQAWRVVSPSETEIRAEVPVLVFTDDLVVTLRAIESGVALEARSASRVGQGDFGENRRHLLQLLAALDEKLPTLLGVTQLEIL